MQTLNADLLSHDSATETLTRWCARLRLSPGKVTAQPLAAPDSTADPTVRALLAAGPETAIRHRRVALACGSHVLSEADNWYRPDRLTPEMNRQLDETDTPFGAVARPLNFHRRTLSVRLLFQPLLDGWEHEARPRSAPGRLAVPRAVLEHRAILETPDGTPLSLVVETYTAEVLEPRSRR